MLFRSDYFSEKWDNGGLINLEKIESARLGRNGIEGWMYSGCEAKFHTGKATIVFNTRQNLIELYDSSDNANVSMDHEISEAIDEYFGFVEW